mmetsp:Transcript_80780/g.224823  ORF Transcript_80780/g.224823 Transcript_80780/m.224823 type:complete len:262 (+) Transcript_80780:420-1205(+)
MPSSAGAGTNSEASARIETLPSAPRKSMSSCSGCVAPLGTNSDASARIETPPWELRTAPNGTRCPELSRNKGCQCSGPFNMASDPLPRSFSMFASHPWTAAGCTLQTFLLLKPGRQRQTSVPLKHRSNSRPASSVRKLTKAYPKFLSLEKSMGKYRKSISPLKPACSIRSQRRSRVYWLGMLRSIMVVKGGDESCPFALAPFFFAFLWDLFGESSGTASFSVAESEGKGGIFRNSFSPVFEVPLDPSDFVLAFSFVALGRS